MSAEPNLCGAARVASATVACSAETLAHRLRLALGNVERARAGLLAAEARALAALKRRGRFCETGFATFGDLAREVLRMHPRTAARRVRLHEALTGSPMLRDGFLAGELSACRVLALRPLLDAHVGVANGPDSGTGSTPFAAGASREPADFPLWIALARSVSVRELDLAVRAAVAAKSGGAGNTTDPERAGFARDDDADSPLPRLAIRVPAATAVLFERTLDVARRVLGYDAPRHACFAAMLAELDAPAAHEAEGDAADGPGPAGAPRRRDCDRPPVDAPAWDAPSLRADTATAIRQTLSLAQRELDGIDALTADVECDDAAPADLLRTLAGIRVIERPLRALTARLLGHLDDAAILAALGHRSVFAFADEALGWSERAVRDALRRRETFRDEPLLERAWATGRIGLGQALLIRRVMRTRALAAWIDRASSVTHRQLEAEVRLVERVQEFLPGLAHRFPGPFPMPGLATALAPGEPGIETDPACDPTILNRLERLLDAAILAAWEDLPVRQTLSTGGAPADHAIRFAAPAAVIEDWRRLLRRARPLPGWAVLTLACREVLETWESTDPDRRPREHGILERDGWHCRVPGCSSRSRLEVHHVTFRSRGGSNDGENKVTLCHAHHRRGIHEGRLRVEGRAPGHLAWRLGAGPQPVLRLVGNRILTPPGEPVSSARRSTP